MKKHIETNQSTTWQIPPSATAKLGGPQTFQIQKFLNTTPGGDPFVPLAVAPQTDRQSRLKGYIAQFDAHVAPDQYSRAEVSIRGLACPFAKSNPEAYMSIDACRITEGFKEPRLLFEHIWRKHTRFFRCDFCDVRWSISTSRKKVAQKKEEHWKTCEGKRRGRLYGDGPDEDRTELLDWKQQERFERVKSIRDVGAKLEALYKACGKPVPETYHATAALPILQPHIASWSGVRTTTGPDQQSLSQSDSFWDGFAPVPSGTPSRPRKPTTSTNVSKANAVLRGGGGIGEVSGANRPRDTDSGYESIPKNNGDDVSPADNRLHAQPGAYWHVPHGVRQYEKHTVTASTAHASSDHTFAPAHDYMGDDYLSGYEGIDPLLCGGASSSERRNDVLRDLAETAEEPLTLWAYTDINVDFAEY